MTVTTDAWFKYNISKMMAFKSWEESRFLKKRVRTTYEILYATSTQSDWFPSSTLSFDRTNNWCHLYDFNFFSLSCLGPKPNQNYQVLLNLV